MAHAKMIEVLWKDLAVTTIAAFGAALLAALLFGLTAVLLASPARAGEAEFPAGTQRMEVDQVQRGSLLLRLASGGTSVDAPTLATDVQMNVSGMTARVTVQQRFRNPGSGWVEGLYVFPLPENAAVDRLRMKIGERVIEGEIREKEQARKMYEQARREGKKASLLSQQRPNIFTTAVANIAPGEEVTVEIEYQQELRYQQGEFTLRFPLVVAPRYIPGVPVAEEEVKSFQGSGWADNTDQVPDASRITPPVVDPAEGKINPVTIQVRLDAGFPLARLESRYHPIEQQQDPQEVYHVRLQSGAPIPADRDFELVWTPAKGNVPHAALFAEQWDGAQYTLLMVMPPVQPAEVAQRVPREAIFVIDTSGSMQGESIQQARAALRLALQRLTPADRFNVIQFNDRPDALFSQAVPADPGNLQRALQYVDGLEAQGGTEMLSALQLALDGQDRSGMLRQVIFLTDGSVGNEEALLKTIHQRLGSSRLFTIGIGSAPNSFFMTRAAQFGRGTFTYIGDVREVRERMEQLFAKLEAPVLTDIHLTWDGAQQVEMWPQRVPDLYLGEPVVVAAKLPAGTGKVEVAGTLNGKPWSRGIVLQGGAASPGVHLLWARRKIADLMDQKAQGRSEEEIRKAVLEVALGHRLVSRYTSLVAVDKTPVRPAGTDLAHKPVPTNLPHGWSASHVFGNLPQTATPAPLQLLLGLLALLCGVWMWRFGGRFNARLRV